MHINCYVQQAIETDIPRELEELKRVASGELGTVHLEAIAQELQDIAQSLAQYTVTPCGCESCNA